MKPTFFGKRKYLLANLLLYYRPVPNIRPESVSERRFPSNVPTNRDVDLNGRFPDKIMIDFSLAEMERYRQFAWSTRGKDFQQTESQERE